MKVNEGFVLTCVDKAIGPRHQKLSWFWKILCWLRFSWCKVYGERALVWNRRCWWQTTQEKKNEEKKEKKHENEEERIGLHKCSLANVTKNGVEKDWSSSISLLLLGGVYQRTSSFFFPTSFWNCSTMNTSYYLSFILTIHHFFWFSSLLVWRCSPPNILFLVFSSLLSSWRNEAKKEEEGIRCVRWWTPLKMKWKKG